MGEWICGFAANLGLVKAPIAELRRIWAYELEIAWKRGVRRLAVEIDSQLVMRLLQKDVDVLHPHYSMVTRCQGFMTRGWIVRFSHIFRKGNRMTDSLANFVFSLNLGLHVLQDPL